MSDDAVVITAMENHNGYDTVLIEGTEKEDGVVPVFIRLTEEPFNGTIYRYGTLNVREDENKDELFVDYDYVMYDDIQLTNENLKAFEAITEKVLWDMLMRHAEKSIGEAEKENDEQT